MQLKSEKQQQGRATVFISTPAALHPFTSRAQLLIVFFFKCLTPFLWQHVIKTKLIRKMNGVVMCDTTDFLSDPIPSKIQAGIDGTDQILNPK